MDLICICGEPIEYNGIGRPPTHCDKEHVVPAELEGRTCATCGVWKTAESFYFYKTTGKLWSYCRECYSKRQKSRHARRYVDDQYRAGVNAANKRAKEKLREEVRAAYGDRCACCGEIEPRFLTLDHVNDDGAQHRRETGLKTGQSSWAFARRTNYPDIFQLLCWNCNSAKGAYGTCPHQESLLLIATKSDH